MMAFPSHKTVYWLMRQGDKPIPNEVIEQGMELRDYFATEAMCLQTWFTDIDNSFAAKRCYEIADAMMEARKK